MGFHHCGLDCLVRLGLDLGKPSAGGNNVGPRWDAVPRAEDEGGREQAQLIGSGPSTPGRPGTARGSTSRRRKGTGRGFEAADRAHETRPVQRTSEGPSMPGTLAQPRNGGALGGRGTGPCKLDCRTRPQLDGFRDPAEVSARAGGQGYSRNVSSQMPLRWRGARNARGWKGGSPTWDSCTSRILAPAGSGSFQLDLRTVGQQPAEGAGSAQGYEARRLPGGVSGASLIRS